MRPRQHNNNKHDDAYLLREIIIAARATCGWLSLSIVSLRSSVTQDIDLKPQSSCLYVTSNKDALFRRRHVARDSPDRAWRVDGRIASFSLSVCCAGISAAAPASRLSYARRLSRRESAPACHRYSEETWGEFMICALRHIVVRGEVHYACTLAGGAATIYSR